MEEVKQSRVHLDLAKSIVNKISNGECHVSQRAAAFILKPLLEDHISPAILKVNKIPEKWYKN